MFTYIYICIYVYINTYIYNIYIMLEYIMLESHISGNALVSDLRG